MAKVTETEKLYEDALQSADVIYKLAEATAREGILEELDPKVKRFVSRKLQSEIENSEDDLENDELENVLDVDDSEEITDGSEEVLTDDEMEPTEPLDEPEIEDSTIDINIDDINDEIDLDLSDILDSDDEISPEETEQTEDSIEIDDDEIEESAQIDETEDGIEELDIDALVKEIEAEETGEPSTDDDELDLEIVDDEIEESAQIDETDDDDELDLEIVDDETEEDEEIDESFNKEAMIEENKKLKMALTILQEKVNEFVLVNKKLKLISKSFALNNFSKKEKMKIIGSFDRATNVNESIKVFNTIKEAVKKSKTRRISEGGASKVIGSTKPPKQENVIVEQENKTFKKWGRLSGARKGTFLED